VELPNGKIELHFEDGLVTACDILIGADGIKSVVRRKMLAEQARHAMASGKAKEAEEILQLVEPHWTGIVAYRALVPTERLIRYRDQHPEQKIRVPEHDSIPIMVRG
jgi:salicylate hydroxylase